MWNCSNWGAGLPFGLGNFLIGFGPWGGLIGLLISVFVIYLIIKLVMSLIPRPNAKPDKYDSLTILKNRLAKGEISQEEYHKMYDLLKT